MGFEKLPPVKGSVACLTCGAGARTDLEMERVIAVGFGAAGYYTTDQKYNWSEGNDPDEEFPTVADVEKMAAADPDRDWRIFFAAPLYEAEYQRQGEGEWILVKKGEGFA